MNSIRRAASTTGSGLRKAVRPFEARSHERRAAEHAERLRLLGELCTGLVHDLRNVQNGLSLRLQLLERSPAGRTPEVAELLAEMRQDIRVGVELLGRVRAFGRGDEAAGSSLVDVDGVAAEACALASARAPAADAPKPELRSELSSPPPVVAHRGELVSAVLNLLVNAVDAVPARGPVVVRTGFVGSHVWIDVLDQGPGIPPDVKARMFEPFFTTKGTRGTGLGLASAADCAARHGGELHVRTGEGAGTTVRISLPAAPT